MTIRFDWLGAFYQLALTSAGLGAGFCFGRGLYAIMAGLTVVVAALIVARHRRHIFGRA